MWRLSRLGTSVDWAAFLARQTDPGTRFCAAIAAAMGNAAGQAVLDVLWETVRQRVAEPGLGTKSPPRYLVAVLALAELQAPGSAAAIGGMLNVTTPPPDLVLLLRALARTGEAQAIEIIQRFLRESAEQPFTTPLWGADPAHPTPFREAIVIRAVRSLVLLGSTHECARLEAWRHHPLLLTRRHARWVLAEAASRHGRAGRSGPPP
jgi:hypothetical protein